MSGEILYAGVADLKTAEVLSTEFLFLLASRDALPNHPALMYAGDAREKGSRVFKVPHIGLMGYDDLEDVADGSAVGNTDLTDGSTTISVSQKSKAYEASDMARLTDSTGLLRPELFAADAMQSAMNKLVDLVADVIDGFTSTAGTSGSNMTFADFLEAVTLLEIANVQGPYMCELHGRQLGDLQSDLATTTGGSIQWRDDVADLLTYRGDAYKGKLLNVDMFRCNRVVTANSGADRAGAMWGRGGVIWADMSFVPEGDPDQLLIGNKVLFERDRTRRSALTAYITHTYLGASKGIDSCGVSIVTDA